MEIMLLGCRRRGTHIKCGGETLRKRSVGGQKIIWAKSLKMDDRERRNEEVRWMQLAKGRVQ
jgi:hypothetical protein